jgi:hypothetical protein
MKAIFALAALLLAGCAQSPLNPLDPPSVHAGPPPVDVCAAGFAKGDYGAKESPGSYIALVNCPAALLLTNDETDTQTLTSCGKNNVVSMTTTQDIHVHSIRLWIGAGVGSRMETGVCLEVITSGVVKWQFHREWDKHIEEHFPDQPFAVDLVIPANSTVRLSRDPHSAGPCNDSIAGAPGTCLTQEMVELWGD